MDNDLDERAGRRYDGMVFVGGIETDSRYREGNEYGR